MGQTKNTKYSSYILFPKMVSFISGSFYHAGVCSNILFSDHLGFNELFVAIKIGGDMMSKQTLLVIGLGWCRGGNSVQHLHFLGFDSKCGYQCKMATLVSRIILT